jgi:hypothetical protein
VCWWIGKGKLAMCTGAEQELSNGVDAKVDLQTQRANTRNRYPKRAS